MCLKRFQVIFVPAPTCSFSGTCSKSFEWAAGWVTVAPQSRSTLHVGFHKMFPLCFHKTPWKERNRNKKLVNLQVCSVATLLFRFACFCNWKIGKLDLNNGNNLVKPTPNGWMILCILNKSIYYSVHLSSMKMRGSIGYHYLYMLQYLAFCGIPGFEIPAFGTRSRASGEESPFDWPPPGPSSTSWRQACCTINTGSCQSAFLDKVHRKQNRSGESWGGQVANLSFPISSHIFK